MMTKLIYDYRIFASQSHGGISRYFYEIIRNIICLEQIQVTVFAGMNRNKYGIESLLSDRFSFLGIKALDLPKTWRLYNFLSELAFSVSLALNSTKYDIYHPTYYYSRRPKLKAFQVVTVHDMTHEILPQYFSKNDKTPQNKVKTIKDADLLIAVSNSTKNDLINIYDIEKEKIRVIYHGNSLVSPVDQPPLVEYPYILFVGCRSSYKNFNMLLNAYAKNMKINSNFDIVAFGSMPFKRSELKEIKKLGVTGKIRHVSGDDSVLSNLYKYASVFVYPSLYEGFGIPLLEAMHYGCPVIASNTSSIAEVVGNAGLLFNPYDVEAIGEALEKILFANVLRKQLIEAGYARGALFSWKRAARETLDTYKEVIGK
jgi:glycosyltransferase involved in cell wall biosynthesis